MNLPSFEQIEQVAKQIRLVLSQYNVPDIADLVRRVGDRYGMGDVVAALMSMIARNEVRVNPRGIELTNR